MAFPILYGILILMAETTVHIDKAGRIVLPKPLREHFRLRNGDTLAVEAKGDTIELRPTHAVGQLKRVNGVLVFNAPTPLVGGDFVGQSRDERIDDVLGPARTRR
jgi:AbrB family looped-hinge helix DNA binding protein